MSEITGLGYKPNLQATANRHMARMEEILGPPTDGAKPQQEASSAGEKRETIDGEVRQKLEATANQHMGMANEALGLSSGTKPVRLEDYRKQEPPVNSNPQMSRDVLNGQSDTAYDFRTGGNM